MSEKPKMSPQVAAEILNALKRGDAIVCLTKCWPCQFGQHTDSPHTWMDDEDLEHEGMPLPTGHASRAKLAADRPCGCWCNEPHRGAA